MDIFRYSSRPLDATPPLVSHTIAEPAPSLAVPDTDTLRHWLALLHAPGVGAIRFLRILEHEPDLPRFFENRGTSL